MDKEPEPRRADPGAPETRYLPLPGGGEPIEGYWYVCPEGDFDFISVGEAPPRCPVHDLELILKHYPDEGDAKDE